MKIIFDLILYSSVKLLTCGIGVYKLKLKLNCYQCILTIISIVLSPLTAVAESQPESITKLKKTNAELSIESDIKINHDNLIKKLIQSKEISKKYPQKKQ